MQLGRQGLVLLAAVGASAFYLGTRFARRGSRTLRPPSKGPSGVRRSRFKEHRHSAKVICAASASEYHRTIEHLVTSSDVVLEVGCLQKETTDKLRAAAGQVVGLHMSAREMQNQKLSAATHRREQAREALPAGALHFQHADVWDTGQLLELQERWGATVIYVDLNVIIGHDLLLDGLALVRSLIQTFQGARAVVIKSRETALHASRCVNAVHALDGVTKKAAAKLTGYHPQLRVLCAVGVEEYRKAIACVVEPDSKVLEIGCHTGKTTQIIQHALEQSGGLSGGSGSVVGVDISKKGIKLARETYPTVRFEVADGWDSWGLQQLGAFTVIFVDIGGISGTDGLLEALGLVRQLSRAFQPSLRAVVIKSRCMRDHASQFVDARGWLYERYLRARAIMPVE